MNVGPMLNGYDRNHLIGAGTIVWKAEKLYASGAINFEQLVDIIAKGLDMGLTRRNVIFLLLC